MTQEQEDIFQKAREQDAAQSRMPAVFSIGNKVYKVYKPKRRQMRMLDRIVRKEWFDTEQAMDNDEVSKADKAKTQEKQDWMMARSIALLLNGHRWFLTLTGLIGITHRIHAWWIDRMWNSSQMSAFIYKAYDPTSLLFFSAAIKFQRSQTEIAREMISRDTKSTSQKPK